MTLLSILFSCLLVSISVSRAEEPDRSFSVDTNDPAALQEATRVLAEEVKLAARPHPYILIDLVSGAVVIKGRGIELHRLPIARWQASSQTDLASLFTLRERPPITRRKIDPAATAEQDPIALSDMPTEYQLRCVPPFTLSVDSQPLGIWQQARELSRTWWRQLAAWWTILSTGERPAAAPFLQLTLRPEQAQSLAWTVTEQMPLLIRRLSAL